MDQAKLNRYRDQLMKLDARLRGTALGMEDQARAAAGGQGAAGNLSNAPMHLGDVGTETFDQELNSALYENEEQLLEEVEDAVGRVDKGTFGRCENCGTDIPEERLDTLPYVRYCTPCASKMESGRRVNINVGRPQSPADATAGRVPGARPGGSGRDGTAVGLQDLDAGLDPDDASPADPDVHAAGTPGGGTAVGGLAGTNVGGGDPDSADLDAAMGSGNFDAAVEGGEGDDDQEVGGYGGRHGGAVGGTPANKRASGGKTGRGIAPSDDTAGPAGQ